MVYSLILTASYTVCTVLFFGVNSPCTRARQCLAKDVNPHDPKCENPVRLKKSGLFLGGLLQLLAFSYVLEDTPNIS